MHAKIEERLGIQNILQSRLLILDNLIITNSNDKCTELPGKMDAESPLLVFDLNQPVDINSYKAYFAPLEGKCVINIFLIMT